MRKVTMDGKTYDLDKMPKSHNCPVCGQHVPDPRIREMQSDMMSGLTVEQIYEKYDHAFLCSQGMHLYDPDTGSCRECGLTARGQFRP